MADLRTTYQPSALTPFAHQWEALQATYNKRVFALCMDPGLGKTKVIFDTAALLFERGHISGLLVLAPNDVHAQWVDEQLPLHLPSRVRHRTAVWDADRESSIKACVKFARNAAPPGTLDLLAMNHEALATDRGYAVAKRFLLTHPTLFVLDESHEFKTPSAKRTRAVLRLAPLAFARRIVTGTLTGGSPFDLYSQYRFLSPKILDCDSFLTFQHRYAQWTRERTLKTLRDGTKKLVEYPELQGYQNLDQLRELTARYTFVKRKQDCADLPPKMYAIVPTHLSPAQRSIYTRLLEDGVALLERAESGEQVAVNPELLEDEELMERVDAPDDRISYAIKLTLLLRLQQCVAGFTTDDNRVTQPIHADWRQLPRLKTLVARVQSALRTSTGKCIVWAHFRPALQMIADAFADEDIEHVLVHGGVVGRERAERIAAFKRRDPTAPRVLLAHPRTLGTGQNFEMAQEVVYYTRAFSYIQRVQSEDRAHRLSSTGTVTITDLVARDAATDAREMEVLQARKDLISRFEPLSPKQLQEMLRC